MRKTIIYAVLCCALLIGGVVARAQNGNGVVGFAVCNSFGQNGVTGGGNGEVVHVSSRQELAKYAGSTAPYVIIIDNDIDGGGMNDLQDELSINSNKTIIGAGSGKKLNGIGLTASSKHNIIIRNIYLKKGRIDGVAFHNCHHVWIDHCDLSDSYDGLLDITNGSDFFTVSWVKLHDHNKVSITNSGTCHYEDYNKERVTFAHCMFKNNTQRNPRIGYGKMHIYNSYWEQISSYCIGFHSQAQVLSENNYFSSSARKPFCNQYTDQLPYAGYLTDRGSYFANGDPGRSDNYPFKDISYSPTDYYNYSFDLVETNNVVTATPTGIGPKKGIQYEPILNPGNGAIDVQLSQTLSWGNIDGASASKMFFGTSADAMTECKTEDVVLKPETQYYWRVVSVVGQEEYSSPIYTFITASNKASKPYPENGSKQPWLRYPSNGRSFCTDMPLTWCNAADAKSYKVYLTADGADIESGYCGETTGLSLVPGNLQTGKTYSWRVDVVKNDGTTVKGDVWFFSTPNKQWKEGKVEAETMYTSGIAFCESNTSSSAGQNTVGDQGPGALCGVWGGTEGRYAIETAVYNQTMGANLIGVSVNGKTIDTWLTSDKNDKLEIRKTRNTVYLKSGDDIRIDFVAGLIEGGTNQGRARIDYINFVPTTNETIDVARETGIYHEPVSTTGYDCEYLPIKNIVFADTLGTVGEKGSIQVKDRYCSWISLLNDNYVLYLKQTTMVKAVYRTEAGAEVTVTTELDKDQQHAFEVAATHDNAQLLAVRLYKTLPIETICYSPQADAGKDYQLILSPDVIFEDVNGLKGNAGKVQIRQEYEKWTKYHNPSANEVHAKKDIKAYILPETDKDEAFVPKGKDGSTWQYVVGTTKYATYYLQHCSRIRLYYTGTGGSSTSVYVTVVNLDTEEQTIYEGDPAPGKNVTSAVFDTQLSPDHSYAVKISGSTGDMLVYAVKLWPGMQTGIDSVAKEGNDVEMLHNLSGQAVYADAKGIIISKGCKHISK